MGLGLWIKIGNWGIEIGNFGLRVGIRIKNLEL